MTGLLRNLAARLARLLTRRDPRFAAEQRRFLAAHPACEFCRGIARTAHHSYPVHAYRELEMRTEFWVPVCRDCHRPYGHGGDWAKWVDPAYLPAVARLTRAGLAAEAEELVRRHTLGPARPKG